MLRLTPPTKPSSSGPWFPQRSHIDRLSNYYIFTLYQNELQIYRKRLNNLITKPFNDRALCNALSLACDRLAEELKKSEPYERDFALKLEALLQEYSNLNRESLEITLRQPGFNYFITEQHTLTEFKLIRNQVYSLDLFPSTVQDLNESILALEEIYKNWKSLANSSKIIVKRYPLLQKRLAELQSKFIKEYPSRLASLHYNFAKYILETTVPGSLEIDEATYTQVKQSLSYIIKHYSSPKEGEATHYRLSLANELKNKLFNVSKEEKSCPESSTASMLQEINRAPKMTERLLKASCRIIEFTLFKFNYLELKPNSSKNLDTVLVIAISNQMLIPNNELKMDFNHEKEMLHFFKHLNLDKVRIVAKSTRSMDIDSKLENPAFSIPTILKTIETKVGRGALFDGIYYISNNPCNLALNREKFLCFFADNEISKLVTLLEPNEKTHKAAVAEGYGSFHMDGKHFKRLGEFFSLPELEAKEDQALMVNDLSNLISPTSKMTNS